LGQSAGDDQYQDPFTPPEAQQRQPSQSQQQPPPQQPDTGTPGMGAATPPVSREASAAAAEAAAPAVADREELPRTGADPVAPAALGLALLLAGGGLRRRLRPARRPS
jgi:LPXTG-motif cell wall-anchored protein